MNPDLEEVRGGDTYLGVSTDITLSATIEIAIS